MLRGRDGGVELEGLSIKNPKKPRIVAGLHI
jgi:hypothetical protein